MRVSRQLVEAERLREIAELAEAVADRHCRSGRVEPVQIARVNGITMSFGEYGEAFDGMLEHRNARWHIYCNRERSGDRDAARARFTVAHELGHFYIDEHRNTLAGGRTSAHRSQCEYESPILAEQEADHFAANLLMPTARFVVKARAASRGLAGILAVAEAFGTSLTSTAIRCAETDVFSCAVVKWTWKGYSWKRLSSATFRARLGRTFEAPAELAEGSPTRRALAHEAPPEEGFFRAGTTASAWFPRVGAGDYRDAIFVEEALPLGRFGVLTVLHAERRG